MKKSPPGSQTAAHFFLVAGEGQDHHAPKGFSQFKTNRLKLLDAELTGRLPWISKLDPARKGVLINMAFQMGVAGLLGFKNTLALIQSGKYQEAARAMLQSKWATHTPARAQRLSNQMATGNWQ